MLKKNKINRDKSTSTTKIVDLVNGMMPSINASSKSKSNIRQKLSKDKLRTRLEAEGTNIIPAMPWRHNLDLDVVK